MSELVITTFKISKQQLERLDELASKLKVTRSELIRRAISEYLEKHKTESKKQITVKRYVLW